MSIKRFIEAQFYEISLKDEFCAISAQLLEKLLRSEGLCVSSEYWVLEALIRWVVYDSETRIGHIDSLIPLIRFPVIPDDFKLKIINDCPNEEIRQKILHFLRLLSEPSDNETRVTVQSQPRMNCTPSIYIFGGGDYYLANKCRLVSVLDNVRHVWTKAKPMRFEGIGHESAEMNGLIYVAGGYNDDVRQSLIAFYAFDPMANQWTKLKLMKYGRSSFLLVPFEGNLFAIGGNKHSLLERFDPKQNDWICEKECPPEFGGDSPFANSPVSGCIYKDKIIFAAQDLVYSYVPTSGEWKRLPNMLRKRHLFKMATLHDYVYAANATTMERYSFAEVSNCSDSL
jgi:hypothetical protein